MADGVTKGDERRSALLEALDHQLRDSTLDEINIADISKRAGVTRSAFYFYFENKAAAVGALMSDMYDEGFDAAEVLGGDGAMRDRVAAAIRSIFVGWGQRTHLYRAMLDARAASAAVRDQYDSFQASFIAVVADLIEDERAAGLAPAGVDATAMATALLDLNDRTLERVARATGDFDWDKHMEAVVHVWVASIYGSERMKMKYDEVTFPSGSVDCHAWHFTGEGDALATDAGRPVVVMAHGLAGTKDSGLQPFAEALAGAGLDVFAFDYRGFGLSAGSPRQTVSMADQLDDYRAAMAAAARLPGVDPNRIVLWGVSLAGGHVFAAAADRTDVAAVVALTPLVDGMAAGRHALAYHKPSAMLRSTVIGVRSRVGSAKMMPVVARPGELGALTLEGCYESYLAIAGPSWRNEVDAAVGLELGNHRPGKQAKDVRAPLLVQIADFDRSAPPQAAAKAAFAGRAEVRHYPCDHFDVYAGADWHDAVVAHQILFLTRHLSAQGG